MDTTYDIIDIDTTTMDLCPLVSLDDNPEVTPNKAVFHGGPGEDDLFVDMASPSGEVYRRGETHWYQTSGQCAFCHRDGVQRYIFNGSNNTDPREWEVLIVCDEHTDATFDWR